MGVSNTLTASPQTRPPPSNWTTHPHPSPPPARGRAQTSPPSQGRAEGERKPPLPPREGQGEGGAHQAQPPGRGSTSPPRSGGFCRCTHRRLPAHARVFEAGQYPVPSTHVTQYSPTFGAPVRLPCSKSPSRGRFMSITGLHGTPLRRGLRALHAKAGLHTRLIDLLRFPRPPWTCAIGRLML